MVHQRDSENDEATAKHDQRNGRVASAVFTVTLQVITVLVVPYLVWVTSGIYDLREWRALSMKINADQDGKLSTTDKAIASLIDKMVPVALTTQVQEMRGDVKNLEKTVSELSGILREHTRRDADKNGTKS